VISIASIRRGFIEEPSKGIVAFSLRLSPMSYEQYYSEYRIIEVKREPN